MQSAFCLLLSACAVLSPTPLPPAATVAPITIAVVADGQTRRFALSQAVTVREFLAQSGIITGELDRLEPGPLTTLTDGATLTITRIRETFETQQNDIPYRSDIIPNEGLPRGERRLQQAGLNGKEEITYRIVFEDGVQVSRSAIKREIIIEPVPEIIFVGAQQSFTVVPVTGALAYLSGGNAWVMRGDSSKRTPLTTSGDLDGFVFDLSPDGQFLLFSRNFTDTRSLQYDRVFNNLWVITTTTGLSAKPFSIPVSNTLYAEWSPVQTISPTIAYSTAEKNPRGPVAWQATTDLWLMTWGRNPRTRRTEFNPVQVVDTNAGGAYGWWGTGYAFAPDGGRIAFARTDSVGIIDLATFGRTELTSFVAYNSRSNWAWYPTLRWADGEWLYTVTHGAPFGIELPEDSPAFDIIALSSVASLELDLVPRAGIYANPVPSPTGERVVYLQAVDPNTSPFSRYTLTVMDRDGSNIRSLFPPSDQPGLDAGATPAWSSDGR
ncbi:MAG: G5 domain-containing protein, partial [Anaerolineales bacterium]